VEIGFFELIVGPFVVVLRMEEMEIRSESMKQIKGFGFYGSGTYCADS
jgi:hypothetical protein